MFWLHFPSFTPSSPSQLHSYWETFTSCLSLEQNRLLRDNKQPDKNTIWWSKSYHINVRHDNLTESSRAGPNIIFNVSVSITCKSHLTCIMCQIKSSPYHRHLCKFTNIIWHYDLTLLNYCISILYANLHCKYVPLWTLWIPVFSVVNENW